MAIRKMWIGLVKIRSRLCLAGMVPPLPTICTDEWCCWSTGGYVEVLVYTTSTSHETIELVLTVLTCDICYIIYAMLLCLNCMLWNTPKRKVGRFFFSSSSLFYRLLFVFHFQCGKKKWSIGILGRSHGWFPSVWWFLFSSQLDSFCCMWWLFNYKRI